MTCDTAGAQIIADAIAAASTEITGVILLVAIFRWFFRSK